MPPFSKICKLYKVKDGHISVICVSDQEFLALCDALRSFELKENPRFKTLVDRLANWDYLSGEFAQALIGMTVEQALTLLERHDIPSGPIRAAPSDDMQVLHN